MNETDGRRQRGERARAQVLEHATAIASTDGLEGLTIGRLATDAGVGKGNIQVLFGDKETLQLATLDAGVVHYREMVVEPALALESPLARLRALTDGWFDYVASGASPGGCFVCAASYEYRARPGAIRIACAGIASRCARVFARRLPQHRRPVNCAPMSTSISSSSKSNRFAPTPTWRF